MHTGGNSTQVLNLPAGIAGDAYFVELTAPGKARTTQIVFVNNQ
ncbi:MAG: hypothetical protein ABI707_09950 [Ferruginibacter sp.]